MVRRLVIKGSSGAGKSTLAAELARRFGFVHVELDALYHGPNWTPATAAEFRARVTALLDDERGWVERPTGQRTGPGRGVAAGGASWGTTTGRDLSVGTTVVRARLLVGADT